MTDRSNFVRRGLPALLISLAFLSPYAVMFLTSLKPAGELTVTPGRLLPRQPTFAAYIDMWSAAPIGQYVGVSLFVAGASTVLVLLVSVPAAYCLARFEFPARRPFLLFVLSLQLIAPVALVVGIYRQFALLGLLDNLGSLVLINAAFNTSFSVWLLRGFIVTIPVALEEAAWLDGCSRLRALITVVLPTIRSGLVTASIYAFIASWNEFIVALTLITTEQRKPLQVGVTQFIGRDDVQWQYLFAASLVAIVPVVVLFALMRRHLVGGLTAGGVK